MHTICFVEKRCATNYADIITKIESKFYSIGKQQFVKAELSGLSFQDMVIKSGVDRKKSLRYLVATIEHGSF